MITARSKFLKKVPNWRQFAAAATVLCMVAWFFLGVLYPLERQDTTAIMMSDPMSRERVAFQLIANGEKACPVPADLVCRQQWVDSKLPEYLSEKNGYTDEHRNKLKRMVWYVLSSKYYQDQTDRMLPPKLMKEVMESN